MGGQDMYIRTGTHLTEVGISLRFVLSSTCSWNDFLCSSLPAVSTTKSQNGLRVGKTAHNESIPETVRPRFKATLQICDTPCDLVACIDFCHLNGGQNMKMYPLDLIPDHTCIIMCMRKGSKYTLTLYCLHRRPACTAAASHLLL